MKFLFDENLSHTLVEILASEFPHCTHVRNIGLPGAEDGRVWDHARAQDLMIVSKDTDFRERSYVEGFPPKIIWRDVGNAGTVVIAELLRRERQRIEDFESQQEACGDFLEPSDVLVRCRRVSPTSGRATGTIRTLLRTF